MAKIKVRAFAQGDKRWVGYYDNKRVAPGTVFMIEEKLFSDTWLEKVDEDVKEGKVEKVEVFEEVAPKEYIRKRRAKTEDIEVVDEPTGDEEVI